MQWVSTVSHSTLSTDQFEERKCGSNDFFWAEFAQKGHFGLGLDEPGTSLISCELPAEEWFVPSSLRWCRLQFRFERQPPLQIACSRQAPDQRSHNFSTTDM